MLLSRTSQNGVQIFSTAYTVTLHEIMKQEKQLLFVCYVELGRFFLSLTHLTGHHPRQFAQSSMPRITGYHDLPGITGYHDKTREKEG